MRSIFHDISSPLLVQKCIDKSVPRQPTTSDIENFLWVDAFLIGVTLESANKKQAWTKLRGHEFGGAAGLMFGYIIKHETPCMQLRSTLNDVDNTCTLLRSTWNTHK